MERYLRDLHLEMRKVGRHYAADLRLLNEKSREVDLLKSRHHEKRGLRPRGQNSQKHQEPISHASMSASTDSSSSALAAANEPAPQPTVSLVAPSPPVTVPSEPTVEALSQVVAVEGINSRIRRARRCDDEPFSVTGTAEALASAASSDQASTAPPGTRWRCSICGLLIPDELRAKRHCSTAHGSQPCEPLEVLPAGTTNSSRAQTSTSGYTASQAPVLAAPAYTATSIMPPVAPIFNATRDLVQQSRLVVEEAPLRTIGDSDPEL